MENYLKLIEQQQGWLLKVRKWQADFSSNNAYCSEGRLKGYVTGLLELISFYEGALRINAAELANRDAQMEKEAILDNRWIKIERLPTIDDDVFVWLNGKTEVGHICEEGIWWIERDGGYYPAQSKVTHWMPIPAGPEQED